MNCKIMKDEETLELPYYNLESVCKSLVRKFLNEKGISFKESMNRKKEFLLFRREYQAFSPYFDFVFTRLGYTLENPFLIPNTILDFKDENGMIYYYARPVNDNFTAIQERELLQPLFVDGKEKNICKEVIHSNFDNLRESFIDGNGLMLSLKGEIDSHNFYARQWVHELLKNHPTFCKRYSELLEDDTLLYFDIAELMIYSYKTIQLSFARMGSSSEIYMVRYHSDYMNQLQKKLIETMREKNIVLSNYCLNMANEENIKGIQKKKIEVRYKYE